MKLINNFINSETTDIFDTIILFLILLIFSVYCTGILATDCDVYKSLAGTTFPYEDELKKMNGNCCRLGDVECDDQDNIISV